MEVTVYRDELLPEFKDMHRFNLKVNCFNPVVQNIIRLVLNSGGHVTFREFGYPNSYSAIVE